MDEDHVRAGNPEQRAETAEAPEPPQPSARARYSILLIGALAIGSIGCMCAFIFTIALVL